MKQKLLVLIFSTALFTMGFFTYSSYAASLNDFKNSSYQNGLVVTIVPSGDTFIYSVCYDHYVYSWVVNGNYLYSGNGSSFNIIYNVGFNPLLEPDRNLTTVNSTTSVNVTGGQVVAIKGSISQTGNGNVTIFDNEEDYNNSLNPPLSFWEKTWNGFWDALENLGDGLELADEALWDWIKSIFIDENETPDYNSILVTPAPTPTPIEVIYRQVTTPDGNGGSTTTNQYVYQDSNNNTVVATAIPTNGIIINLPSGNSITGGNGFGGGSSDPSNYSPANPLAIPNYEWLNPHAFAENQNQFPLETLQNAEDFTKEAAENYLTGVTGIFSLLTFIPQELYVVVGIGISIIVIAGIMCKLLGG